MRSKPTLIAPAYSGPLSTCRMCGNVGASTAWQALEGLGSYLSRACIRCSFGWIERINIAARGHSTGQYV